MEWEKHPVDGYLFSMDPIIPSLLEIEWIFDQNVPKDSCSFGCTDSLLDELCIIHLLIHLQSLRCMSKEFYTLKVQPLKDLLVMSVSCATGFFGTQA